MTTHKKTENAASELSFPKARLAVRIMFLEALIPFLAERDFHIPIELFDQCEQECIQADDPERDAMQDELRLIRAAFLQGSIEVRAKVEGNLSVNNPI